MDQCRDPLKGTLVPERGGRLTAAERQGAGRAQRALASDSGVENAGVHGRLSQPGSCEARSVEAAPSQEWLCTERVLSLGHIFPSTDLRVADVLWGAYSDPCWRGQGRNETFRPNSRLPHPGVKLLRPWVGRPSLPGCERPGLIKDGTAWSELSVLVQ